MTILMDVEALNAFLIAEFPQVTGKFRVRSVTPLDVVVEMPMTYQHLRPGGTVSGPTMFALADVSIYLAILARVGPIELAVTTNASIDFMRKPAAGKTLIATARILKLGRILAVGDVLIQSEGLDAPVARASMTYSIPPKR
ncbi:PaaI family thioesterase [Falsihalocynthiibacter arcticus]|uniref:Thioesterase n=1 Tax=Falsihalocynthiibacter arcticus TaxID=1579316 RepID=A0A126V7L9_9RHOB|nr:PaaI family thioesterase [Falsihalocynthiibacter arcticus]AML53719.1 thioesterase [Falsihalocynthiibacter arcticus]